MVQIWFQIELNHLTTYPQLSGGDIGKFVIQDPADGHLIIMCNTKKELSKNLAIISKDSCQYR